MIPPTFRRAYGDHLYHVYCSSWIHLFIFIVGAYPSNIFNSLPFNFGNSALNTSDSPYTNQFELQLMPIESSSCSATPISYHQSQSIILFLKNKLFKTPHYNFQSPVNTNFLRQDKPILIKDIWSVTPKSLHPYQPEICVSSFMQNNHWHFNNIQLLLCNSMNSPMPDGYFYTLTVRPDHSHKKILNYKTKNLSLFLYNFYWFMTIIILWIF